MGREVSYNLKLETKFVDVQFLFLHASKINFFHAKLSDIVVVVESQFWHSVMGVSYK